MLFNTFPFLIFFVCFFFVYWLVLSGDLKFQNLFLLAGSYFFYAWWDWGFLLLLAGSSLVYFLLGISMEKSRNQRRKYILLVIGCLQGLCCLLVFKYLNFFISSFSDLLNGLGFHSDPVLLNLVLPLGISFYTFRGISYLIDVYHEKTSAVVDASIFFSYIAFFPSLISGPIDKANLLIPQLSKPRSFSYDQAVDGMRQLLWGLFKKMVIADNCAALTNPLFDFYESQAGSTLIIGALVYSVQIYADFSGYSDMAIGLAKLIGFRITRNFDFPYFSQNIAEFWRKWHISLTSWLTDYVFTPLSIAFRDRGKAGLIAAILINFTLIGIWHGANWTFVLFGFLHGCFFIPLVLNGTLNKRKKKTNGNYVSKIWETLSVFGTFLLVSMSFILFRSESLGDALQFYRIMFSGSVFSRPIFAVSFLPRCFFTLVLFYSEWLQRNKEHALQFAAAGGPANQNSFKTKPLRWILYVLILYAILFFKAGQQYFIYFNF